MPAALSLFTGSLIEILASHVIPTLSALSTDQTEQESPEERRAKWRDVDRSDRPERVDAAF